MIHSIEPYLDILFDVTDIDAYENAIKHSQMPLKDISHYKRQIYTSEIIDVYKNSDDVTVLVIEENNKKVSFRILEAIEDIELLLKKNENLNYSDEFREFLIQKIKES